MQAEAINARGVYEVGCPPQGKGNRNGEETLESVIHLSVPPKEGDKETKVYNLEELKDLQSKLMLIAAKAPQGKEEVDMFGEVSLQEFLWLFMTFYHPVLTTPEYSTCDKHYQPPPEPFSTPVQNFLTIFLKTLEPALTLCCTRKGLSC